MLKWRSRTVRMIRRSSRGLKALASQRSIAPNSLPGLHTLSRGTKALRFPSTNCSRSRASLSATSLTGSMVDPPPPVADRSGSLAKPDRPPNARPPVGRPPLLLDHQSSSKTEAWRADFDGNISAMAWRCWVVAIYPLVPLKGTYYSSLYYP